LREAGITAPILILGGIYPFENYEFISKFDLIPTVASLESAKALKGHALTAGRPLPFHLKVDTGMGRIGVSLVEARKIIDWVREEKLLQLAGVYSHFPCADTDEKFSSGQINQFSELNTYAKEKGLPNVLFHMANSAAILADPNSHFDMVRPGISLYGFCPVPPVKKISLQPVLSLHSKVIFLKNVPAGTPISYGGTFVTEGKSLIATIPIGYADGVPRLLSNKGFVLVQGKQCSIVGRVTMDQIMVDVTGLNISIGERVTLIGQQGEESISAEEWAEWAQTISYEILCGISKRVPRVVV